jgi:hypothetical protein
MNHELRIMNFVKITVVIFIYLIFYSSFFIPIINAAEFFFNAQSDEWRIGDEIAVSFFLNTNGDDINAIEGRISYPKEFLELKEVRDGNSIINFWVERPQRRQGAGDREQGEIIFSGITPGGYSGEKGLLFSLIFEAKNEGQGVIEIREAKALLNDGQGTQAPISISNFQFLISKQIPDSKFQILDSKMDAEPPESFAPEIANDPALFEGKWFLVFATQDKGVGIDHYEVKEARSKIQGLWIRWVPAESPYLLEDQRLRSYVFVKAVDKAGNARIEKISPRNPLKWYENYDNWIMIIAGLAVAYAFRKFLRRRFLKKRIKNQES